MTYHLFTSCRRDHFVYGGVFAQAFEKMQVIVRSFHCKWGRNPGFYVHTGKEDAQVTESFLFSGSYSKLFSNIYILNEYMILAIHLA